MGLWSKGGGGGPVRGSQLRQLECCSIPKVRFFNSFPIALSFFQLGVCDSVRMCSTESRAGAFLAPGSGALPILWPLFAGLGTIGNFASACLDTTVKHPIGPFVANEPTALLSPRVTN